MWCPKCHSINSENETVCRYCETELVPEPGQDTATSALSTELPKGSKTTVYKAANPLLRLCAFLLDFVLIVFSAWAFGVFLILFIIPVSSWNTENANEIGYWSGLVFGWLYYAYFESSEIQATIGKHLLRIFVTDLNGDRLSFLRASWRWLARISCVLTFGIGYLLILFTPKRQGLHDLFAKTTVLTRKEMV